MGFKELPYFGSEQFRQIYLVERICICICIWIDVFVFETKLSKIFVFLFEKSKFLYLYLYLIKRIWPQPWLLFGAVYWSRQLRVFLHLTSLLFDHCITVEHVEYIFTQYMVRCFQASPNVVLKLRKPKTNRKVKWTEGTVDNEFMNKKKSKCECAPWVLVHIEAMGPFWWRLGHRYILYSHYSVLSNHSSHCPGWVKLCFGRVIFFMIILKLWMLLVQIFSKWTFWMGIVKKKKFRSNTGIIHP